MADYDLTKMDIEGLAYCSDILRENYEGLGEIASKITAYDSWSDVKKLLYVQDKITSMMGQILHRLTDNNDAMEFQFEDMMKTINHHTDEMDLFIEKGSKAVWTTED